MSSWFDVRPVDVGVERTPPAQRSPAAGAEIQNPTQLLNRRLRGCHGVSDHASAFRPFSTNCRASGAERSKTRRWQREPIFMSTVRRRSLRPARRFSIRSEAAPPIDGTSTFMRPLTKPTVDVVIVAYRSRNLLRECLTSLRAYPSTTDTRVTVVDNASGDGTDEMVLAEFPEVTLVPMSENVGFAAANNVAIRQGSACYVLVLNPDTRMTPTALDRMVDLMESNPSIGIAGCRLERDNGTFDHAARRSFPTPLGALGHFTAIGRRRHSPALLAQYRAVSVERGPVDAVNGAFMLIRRRALEKVGLFDEGYWLYMEDLDLCYRFAQAGWVTWYEPDVTVIHVKAGSSGRFRTLRVNYAFHYGMFRFYRKNYAPTRSRVVNAAIYTGIAVKLALSVARSALYRRLLARA
jgi:N-acetylglucosaminyl-diphospho-decaprenol L-rhamnosyltransferase